MKEFMLFIKTEGDHVAKLSPDQQQQHIEKVGAYLQDLMEKGKLKGAQPLEIGGAVVSGRTGAFHDGPFNEAKEVIVGYFHIVAEDIDEAIAIAKDNPTFDEGEAIMEIRPIRSVEGIN